MCRWHTGWAQIRLNLVQHKALVETKIHVRSSYHFSSYKFKYKCKDMQILGSGFIKLTVIRHGNKLHADIHLLFIIWKCWMDEFSCPCFCFVFNFFCLTWQILSMPTTSSQKPQPSHYRKLSDQSVDRGIYVTATIKPQQQILVANIQKWITRNWICHKM